MVKGPLAELYRPGAGSASCVSMLLLLRLTGWRFRASEGGGERKKERAWEAAPDCTPSHLVNYWSTCAHNAMKPPKTQRAE